jgi:dihydroxyacetone kinase
VLAFVNGLGGTPLGELYLVYDELDRQLDVCQPIHRPDGDPL